MDSIVSQSLPMKQKERDDGSVSAAILSVNVEH